MSEEREFAHAEWRQSFFDRTSREPTPSEAWYAALKWQAGRQSAGATGQEAMGALDMLRLAHKTLAWAALTQIRDGERIWNEIGAFLDAATDQEPVGIIERDEINGWHMNALIDWEKIGLGTKLYAAPIGDNGAQAGDFQPLTEARKQAIADSVEQRYGETLRSAVDLAFSSKPAKSDNGAKDDEWCERCGYPCKCVQPAESKRVEC